MPRPHLRSRRPLALLCGLSVAAMAVAGCSATQTLTAKQSVRQAGATLLEHDAVTVTAGLDLTPAARDAIVADILVNDPDASPAGIAAALDVQVRGTIASTDGDALGDLDLSDPTVSEQVSSAVSVLFADQSVVEVRTVGEDAYLRADLPALAEQLGGGTATQDMFDHYTQGLTGHAGEVAAAVGDGRWVAVNRAELATAVSPDAAPDQGPARGALADLGGALKDAVSDNISVEQTGQHTYAVTAPLDTIFAQVSPALTAAVDAVGDPTLAMLGGQFDATESALAGKTATVELTTTDAGALASARVDLLQFAGTQARKHFTGLGVDAVPILLEFTTGGAVQAPTDVLRVDPFDFIAAAGSAGQPPVDDPFADLSPQDLDMTQAEFDALMADLYADPATAGDQTG